MNGAVAFTRATGWIVCAMLAGSVWLVYQRRRNAQAVWSSLWPHFVAGWAAVLLTYAHLDVSMRARLAGRTPGWALWLASIGFVLLLVQVFAGHRLRRQAGQASVAALQAHRRIMLAASAIIVVHLLVNSSSLHALLPRFARSPA
jgi:hypothetical protein